MGRGFLKTLGKNVDDLKENYKHKEVVQPRDEDYNLETNSSLYIRHSYFKNILQKNR